MPRVSTTVDRAGGRVGPPRPPRVYYGWVILPVAIAGVIATSPGQTYAIAAFNPSFRDDLGLSHTALTGAYMLSTLLAAFPLMYVGRAMDRYGLKLVLLTTVGLLGGACLVAAAAQELVTTFIAFFFLRALGPGALSLLSSSTLAFWFDRRLGTVEGVRQLGMAAAVAVVPAATVWLIDVVGWRAAFALMGFGVCAVMLPLVAFVFRNRPEDVGQVIDGGGPRRPSARGGPDMTLRQAARTSAFWIVIGVNSLWALVGTGITFNVVPIAVEQGLDAQAATGLLSAFAASMAVTHVVGGWSADRLPAPLLLSTAAVCMAAAAWLLGTLAVPGVVTACGVAMGVAQGLVGGLTSVLCVRYWGRTHLGQVRAAFSAAIIATSSVGPFVIGFTRDWTGGYGMILTGFVIAGLVAAVAALFVRTPPALPHHSISA